MINDWLLVLALIVLFLLPRESDLFAEGLDQEHYLQSLIDQATEKRLSQQRYWHLLLHYKKSIFGKYESQEDGLSFFNSPGGKSDPQAELLATLSSFFKKNEGFKKGEKHPQCNFPARFKWLSKQLSFDTSRFPKPACSLLEGWLEELNPRRITLVFASYYMNNPASMFGHTLLRIDTKREGPDQSLLNYGINYAATPDTDNPLMYTLKGLFGFFKGRFSVFPYYTKVQQYSNIDNRDLWEYELNFSEDQMNDLLLHLWELGGNYFDYLYFQENCSYHLLALLEVANPDLHLTDSFFYHVIPADTIKVVPRKDNLVVKRVYRPSLLSQMNNKRLKMTPPQDAMLQQLVKDSSWLERDEYRSLEISDKVLILDTYLDYAQYRNMRNRKEEKAPTEGDRKILLARSRLRYQRQDQGMIQFSTLPELGHGSDWLKIGVGRSAGQTFEEISYRPAYHDLLAKDIGYGKDSQILFLDLTARYYNDLEETKLDRLKIIEIISLTPYDRLLQKKSWRFGFGIDSIKDFDCHFCHSFKTSYGLGFSYKSSYANPFLLYALVDSEVEFSKRLDHDYRVGGGGTIGLLLDLTEDWRVQILGNILAFPLGHESDYYKVSINQRVALTQHSDLRVEMSQMEGKDEWVLSGNYYF